ncbi:unnamed protein product [Urochloa decumbens]|uniref:Acidic protein n=1 Tax=Urochloa decumbens TaxID=240449 RepID=A0ABC9FQZ0_9POAL
MESKGVNCVLMCVLLLGLVLEQAQVEGRSCCRDVAARNCYNKCRYAGTSYEGCATFCVCTFVSGTCPPDYPTSNFLSRFEKSDRVEYCSIGCRSLMCDSMDSVDGAEDMKINVKLCGYACDHFCNGDASNTPVVA